MLRLWQAYRPSPGRIVGMAAGVVPVVGHLPAAGGAGDQAAAMMAAFAIMDEAAAEMHRLLAGEG